MFDIVVVTLSGAVVYVAESDYDARTFIAHNESAYDGLYITTRRSK